MTEGLHEKVIALFLHTTHSRIVLNHVNALLFIAMQQDCKIKRDYMHLFALNSTKLNVTTVTISTSYNR